MLAISLSQSLLEGEHVLLLGPEDTRLVPVSDLSVLLLKHLDGCRVHGFGAQLLAEVDLAEARGEPSRTTMRVDLDVLEAEADLLLLK